MEADNVHKSRSNSSVPERAMTPCKGKGPKNVSSDLWEKFKKLEERTNSVTQRSTEKRIKHLQSEVMRKVTEEFTSPEDKDILHHYDVKFGPPVHEPSKGKKRKAQVSNDIEPLSKPSPVAEVLSLVKANPGPLVSTDLSRPPPPTTLEQKLDQAIESGDVTTAEALSDHWAEREMGERITQALDAKEFLEIRKEQEASAKDHKKKKRLNWGFDHKQRWETKGNM